jgi:hypothetical protein
MLEKLNSEVKEILKSVVLRYYAPKIMETENWIYNRKQSIDKNFAVVKIGDLEKILNGLGYKLTIEKNVIE